MTNRITKKEQERVLQELKQQNSGNIMVGIYSFLMMLIFLMVLLAMLLGSIAIVVMLFNYIW